MKTWLTTWHRALFRDILTVLVGITFLWTTCGTVAASSESKRDHSSRPPSGSLRLAAAGRFSPGASKPAPANGQQAGTARGASQTRTVQSGKNSITVRTEGGVSKYVKDSTGEWDSPDGVNWVRRSDGARWKGTVEIDSAGNYITTNGQTGLKVTHQPDGTLIINNPNGSSRVEKPDGTATWYNPDGQRVRIREKDGSEWVYRKDKDGKGWWYRDVPTYPQTGVYHPRLPFEQNGKPTERGKELQDIAKAAVGRNADAQGNVDFPGYGRILTEIAGMDDLTEAEKLYVHAEVIRLLFEGLDGHGKVDPQKQTPYRLITNGANPATLSTFKGPNVIRHQVINAGGLGFTADGYHGAAVWGGAGAGALYLAGVAGVAAHEAMKTITNHWVNTTGASTPGNIDYGDFIASLLQIEAIKAYQQSGMKGYAEVWNQGFVAPGAQRDSSYSGTGGDFGGGTEHGKAKGAGKPGVTPGEAKPAGGAAAGDAHSAATAAPGLESRVNALPTIDRDGQGRVTRVTYPDKSSLALDLSGAPSNPAALVAYDAQGREIRRFTLKAHIPSHDSTETSGGTALADSGVSPSSPGASSEGEIASVMESAETAGESTGGTVSSTVDDAEKIFYAVLDKAKEAGLHKKGRYNDSEGVDKGDVYEYNNGSVYLLPDKPDKNAGPEVRLPAKGFFVDKSKAEYGSQTSFNVTRIEKREYTDDNGKNVVVYVMHVVPVDADGKPIGKSTVLIASRGLPGDERVDYHLGKFEGVDSGKEPEGQQMISEDQPSVPGPLDEESDSGKGSGSSGGPPSSAVAGPASTGPSIVGVIWPDGSGLGQPPPASEPASSTDSPMTPGGDSIAVPGEALLGLLTQDRPLTVQLGSGQLLVPEKTPVVMQQGDDGSLIVYNFGTNVRFTGTDNHGTEISQELSPGEALVIPGKQNEEIVELIPAQGTEAPVIAKLGHATIRKIEKEKFIKALREITLCGPNSESVREAIRQLKAYAQDASIPIAQLDDKLSSPNADLAGRTQYGSFRPVGFVVPPASIRQGTDIGVRRTSELVLWEAPGSAVSFENERHVVLQKGEVIVEAKRKTLVDVPNGKIDIGANTVVLIKLDGDALIVRNLWDGWDRAVILHLTRKVHLSVGHEAIVSFSGESPLNLLGRDGIGRRRVKEHPAEGGRDKIATGEFSLITVINDDPILSQLSHLESREERGLAEKLLNMAAILQIVTRSHGPYAHGPER